MTKFSVLVCLAAPPDDLHTALAAALAPFDGSREVERYREYLRGKPSDYRGVAERLGRDPATMTWEDIVADRSARSPADPCFLDESGNAYHMSTYNRAAQWDYWGIGMQLAGHFRYRAGHESRVLRGDPEQRHPHRLMAPMRCDGGPKESLDLAGMRAIAATEAAAAYERWVDAVRGSPEARPWRDFYDPSLAKDVPRRRRAEDAYYAQPRVRALAGTEFDPRDGICTIELFQRPQAEYVERARAAALPLWATLLSDGRWLEYSTPGFVGFLPPDRAADRHYLDEANLEIDTLPDTGRLVCVGCHF